MFTFFYCTESCFILINSFYILILDNLDSNFPVKIESLVTDVHANSWKTVWHRVVRVHVNVEASSFLLLVTSVYLIQIFNNHLLRLSHYYNTIVRDGKLSIFKCRRKSFYILQNKNKNKRSGYPINSHTDWDQRCLKYNRPMLCMRLLSCE